MTKKFQQRKKEEWALLEGQRKFDKKYSVNVSTREEKAITNGEIKGTFKTITLVMSKYILTLRQ